MKKASLALFIILMSLLIIAPKLEAQELVCEEANGLNWCYNPDACGQPCNEVCEAGGTTPIEDNTVWFEAQNTEDKCRAISRAFGLGDNVNISSFTNACLQDMAMRPHESGINALLECSTDSDCPQTHRTNMDGQGIACNNMNDSSRRSICPCIPLPVVISTPIPTLSEWGLVAMAGILGIVGFMVIRRRKVTA